MEGPTPEKLAELLGTRQIPGSEDQRAILRIRIGELIALNGEKWVRQNQTRLLNEWSVVVASGILSQ